MMKALVSRDHKFRVQEIPRPALREGELLLQVTACGVCLSDVHKIRFQPLEEPVVLGHEVAGRVVESESAKFHVGDLITVGMEMFRCARSSKKPTSTRVVLRSLCVCRRSTWNGSRFTFRMRLAIMRLLSWSL